MFMLEKLMVNKKIVIGIIVVVVLFVGGLLWLGSNIRYVEDSKSVFFGSCSSRVNLEYYKYRDYRIQNNNCVDLGVGWEIEKELGSFVDGNITYVCCVFK